MSPKELLKERLSNLSKSKKGSNIKDQILNEQDKGKDSSKKEALLRRLEKARRKA